MKNYLFLAAATAALLASCTSEVIPERPAVEPAKSPITFSGTPASITRADDDEISPEEADAIKLGKKFFVFGKKVGGASDGVIMNGFKVGFMSNGKWEYSHEAGQDLKYWASDATSYIFAAYSNKNTDKTITKPTDFAANPFEIPVVTADQLSNIYFTPKVTILPTDFSKPVHLVFSNAAAKIRVAFYNTIPGYNIKVLGFYASGDATSTGNDVVFYGEANQFVTAADYQVSLSDASSTSTGISYEMQSNNTADSKITLGDKIEAANIIGGPNISDATFDKTAGEYTFVHPQPNNDKPIILKVYYQMQTTGDHNNKTCTVSIPKEYAQWLPNHAYTYFFKITDSELDPIEFTAAVEEFKNEETITTVDPSNEIDITTYHKGSDVQTNDQYLAGDKITVSVTAPSSITINSKEYGVKEDASHASGLTESNCAAQIDTWTTLNDDLTLDKVGYYVIRVDWTKTDDQGTKSGSAYKVITVKPQPTSGS